MITLTSRGSFIETSTAKVLVSCSDTYFEIDFQTFELFSNGFKAFKCTGNKLSNKLNVQGTDITINGNVQGTDITINGMYRDRHYN